jgi:sRNA-binding carbon storage regulator CsrA
MKKTILIILAISIYTILVAYIFDNVGSQTLVRNGGTYITDFRTSGGYKCIVHYTDKDVTKDSQAAVKNILMKGFEVDTSVECPKTLDVTKQEMLQIIQNRLNDKFGQPIILTPQQ